jgi:hypothetical protein
MYQYILSVMRLWDCCGCSKEIRTQLFSMIAICLLAWRVVAGYFSNSIVQIMNRNNFSCISYIDDFLCVGSSKSECQKALDVLLQLIPRLWLEVNLDKVHQPASVMSFLGVEIDCVRRTLYLPPEKLQEVKDLLGKWRSQTRFFIKKNYKD